ncbi:MAG: EF-hand domain-containing protein [Acidovorax sp.]|uniref:EF-hand domain-containing protein n=1 Tax=Acidovorax sp. TaxID=1872122 RepID=UPI0025BE55C1|nr:EF-hand domain-containing protein [Acidovorax sp.]MCE1191958.1 EF-hand domain-containing protein [Acidovorax sp.]
MKAQQRRISSFDSRSVMLFAALALGGAGALQAQAQGAASGGSKSPAAQGSDAPYSYGPGTGNPSRAATNAFNRADADKDGKLSEQEATQLPAISQRFKELDTDRNGSLSPTEFEKGLLS